jgi:hypothetical protein
MGNYHAGFLGGLGPAMAPGYPVFTIFHFAHFPLNIGNIERFYTHIGKLSKNARFPGFNI